MPAVPQKTVLISSLPVPPSLFFQILSSVKKVAAKKVYCEYPTAFLVITWEIDELVRVRLGIN